MNKYEPHVIVLPEDDATRQLATGFVDYPAVHAHRIRVVSPAGGWVKAVDLMCSSYMPHMRSYNSAHLVLVIDFDKDSDRYRTAIEPRVPAELRNRVFVFGPLTNVEVLKREARRKTEELGRDLASECERGESQQWSMPELQHNLPERDRALQCIRSIIFDE
ncbi:MAG: hypothetical protein ACKVS9_00625 [Phycisphaerae bacterium]